MNLDSCIEVLMYWVGCFQFTLILWLSKSENLTKWVAGYKVVHHIKCQVHVLGMLVRSDM